MRIAISGINGSGKTTLCRSLSYDLEWLYENRSLSNAPFYLKVNYSPLFEMSLSDIQDIQRKYCNYVLRSFKKMPYNFITDTCPSDVAAWFTYWNMTPLKTSIPDLQLRSKVLSLLNEFDLIVKLPCHQFPNPKMDSIGCAELIDSMIVRLLNDSDTKWRSLDSLDMKYRVDFVKSLIPKYHSKKR